MLSVPLTVRERVIGALNCYTTQPRHFSDSEVALFPRWPTRPRSPSKTRNW